MKLLRNLYLPQILLMLLIASIAGSIFSQRNLNQYAGNARVPVFINFWNEGYEKLDKLNSIELEKLMHYPVSFTVEDGSTVSLDEVLMPVVINLEPNQYYYYRVFIDVLREGTTEYAIQKKSSLERVKTNYLGYALLNRIYSIAPMRVKKKGAYAVRLYVKLWLKKPLNKKKKAKVEAACFFLIRNKLPLKSKVKKGKYVYSPMVGNFAWVKKRKVLKLGKKANGLIRVLTPFDHESYIEKKYINKEFDKVK